MAIDNFDDVADLLKDLEAIEEDKNFNEDELQDIMSEIEDLEKDLDGGAFSTASKEGMSLQEKIDAEMNMAEEVVATAKVVKADVLTFDKTAKTIPAPTNFSKSEVGFQARGQMTLNMDFAVGSDVAKLSIDPIKGLIITMAGVELCISEDSGCTVSMDNGIKFTIPLSAQTISHTKKTA